MEATVADHPLHAVRAALLRFAETTEDCNETDLPRPMLDALVAFGYLTRRKGGRHGFIYTMTPDGDAVVDATAATARPQGGDAVAIKPEVRDALLFALRHHQGANSPVGQPIRAMLGIGQFDDVPALSTPQPDAVLPAPKVVPYGSASGEKDYAYGHEKGVANGWNACLREVERLSAQGAAGAGEDR